VRSTPWPLSLEWTWPPHAECRSQKRGAPKYRSVSHDGGVDARRRLARWLRAAGRVPQLRKRYAIKARERGDNGGRSGSDPRPTGYVCFLLRCASGPGLAEHLVGSSRPGETRFGIDFSPPATPFSFARGARRSPDLTDRRARRQRFGPPWLSSGPRGAPGRGRCVPLRRANRGGRSALTVGRAHDRLGSWSNWGRSRSSSRSGARGSQRPPHASASFPFSCSRFRRRGG
jgi:hypothetical protein